MRPGQLPRFAVAALAAVGSVAVFTTPAHAVGTDLTITDIGWAVIGLDSNDVTAGENVFMQGGRVCNTSATPVDVTVDWEWQTENANINLLGPASVTRTVDAVDGCTDFYFSVEVTRDAAAYDTTRGYVMTATAADQTDVSSPATRELYVEHLVSQNRNGVTSIDGPAAMQVGDSSTFILTGFTATNGYEQLVASLGIDTNVLRVDSVSAEYATPAGGTNDTFYADACGWDADSSSVDYRSCVGPDGISGGKAGGDPITVAVAVTAIAAGEGVINGLLYDFSGFSYHYNSDADSGPSITYKVTEAGVPALVANDDNTETVGGNAVQVDVLANDDAVNAEIDPSSVATTSLSAHGTTEIDATTGKITYTPEDSYVGDDSFTYQVCAVSDPALCDEATATITVTAAPNVTAGDDTATGEVDNAVQIDVLANDTATGTELAPASVTVTVAPAHGETSINTTTGAITFIPETGWSGDDSFTYQVCGTTETATCDIAVVTVTITQTATVDAVDDAANTGLSTPVEIDILANDTAANTEIDATTVTITEAPVNGTVEVNPTSGTATYTPNDYFEGDDSFTYEVCDSHSVCDTANVAITVDSTMGGTATIDAVEDARTTQVDTAIVIDVTANDAAVNTALDPASVTITTAPEHGATVVDADTGNVTYTPETGWTGTDTFTYAVCDTSDVCDETTVTVKVISETPVVVTADTATTTGTDPVEIDVIGNDTSNTGNPLDPASVKIVTQPANGTAEADPVTGRITYTPNAGYTGTDSFTYQVCDTEGTCQSATVTVEVSAAGTGDQTGDQTGGGTGGGGPTELPFSGNELTLPVLFAAGFGGIASLWIRRRRSY